MAIMIPAHPEFIDGSYEDLIFNSLKTLPDNCFVLHSLSIIDPESKGKKETEIDFTVIIPDVGCVVIEAKSGKVEFTTSETYFNGRKIEPFKWVYESGRPMSGKGPFSQSKENMYVLMSYLEHNKNYSELGKKQKFYNCVWFHQVTKGAVQNLLRRPECPKEQILSSDDLKTPYQSLLNIIRFQDSTINNLNKTPWNYQQTSIIVSNVLAPRMNLVPGKNWEYEYKKEELNKLLQQQEIVLEFISEQNSAAISGAAGTGKTMIALKKAQIESDKGNKVLFLCYNSALSNFLSTNYKNENIDYFNIAQWACTKCKSSTPDYGALVSIIDRELTEENFPYKVIIVDEAQDFGQNVTDNSQVNVLEKLYDAAILMDGLFYLFYDKNQIINSKKLPSYIANADCKLTLYRNCRNTKKIADASLRIFGDGQSSKVGPNVVEGEPPNILFVNGEDDFIDKLSSRAKKVSEKYDNVVILSAKTRDTTSLYEYVDNQIVNIKGKNYPFYTCRQYKGLEADAVILVDVDKNTFKDATNKMLYYVGTSRAKFDLTIVTDMSESDCEDVCKLILKDSFIEGYDYKDQLAAALSIEKTK